MATSLQPGHYRTVAYCVEAGCRCDHRSGVILYAGPSREEAERAAAESPYPGPAYRVEIDPPPLIRWSG